jgi:mannose/fructose/N-acetylgalactosamine-specific phosphotransferase system component IID
MQHCTGALNTNPFTAGFLVGSITRAEYDARQLAEIDRYTDVAQRTLAAGGDRFFWQNLRPTLTALAVLLALYVPEAAVPGAQSALWRFVLSLWPVLAFLIPFNAVAQLTRAYGLKIGYAHGPSALALLQTRLDRWTRSLAPFAALLCGMLLTRAFLTLASHPPASSLKPLTSSALRLFYSLPPSLPQLLLLPAAVVAWLLARARVSQTYVLLLFLLILFLFKLIL